MRRALTLSLSYCLLLMQPLSAFGKEVLPLEVSKFLTSRQVIGSVTFAEGSTTLSREAKREIDKLIPRLQKIDPTESLVRIEGFASPGGGKSLNVPISMARAKAVVDYIQENHPFAASFFLTGFVTGETPETADGQSCRAEVALYDNIWEATELKIEKVGYR